MLEIHKLGSKQHIYAYNENDDKYEDDEAATKHVSWDFLWDFEVLLNDDSSSTDNAAYIFLDNSILGELNLNNVSDFQENYFFIKIPIVFNSSTNLNLMYNPMIKLKLLNIVGIPINKINANFPINYTQVKGYHIVDDIISDYIFITLDVKPYKSLSNYGSNKITLTKIINTIEGYTNPNKYKINLKKILELGHLMKCFYVLNSNDTLVNSLKYSFGFNGYINNLTNLQLQIKNNNINYCTFIEDNIKTDKKDKNNKNDIKSIIDEIEKDTEIKINLKNKK
jgi:hypothetical protein